MLSEWTEEPVKLAPFTKDEKKLILCLDTIGQDRVFSEKEMEFIKKIASTIRSSIEDLEEKLLKKDRDIRIKFDDQETKLKEDEKFLDENYENFIQKYIENYYASEEYKSKNISAEDEASKNHFGEIARSRYLKSLIFENEMKDILLTFQEFEFVEFDKVFQSILYFK